MSTQLGFTGERRHLLLIGKLPSSSGGGLGACSPIKFKKLYTSDWLKLTFLPNKRNKCHEFSPSTWKDRDFYLERHNIHKVASL